MVLIAWPPLRSLDRIHVGWACQTRVADRFAELGSFGLSGTTELQKATSSSFFRNVESNLFLIVSTSRLVGWSTSHLGTILMRAVWL